jgi:formate dehydrogenase
MAPQQDIKIVAVLPPGGQAADNPKYVNCVENGLGLREFAKEKGAQVVITDDKEGKDSELDRNLDDATILITTPFHPAYVTKERVERAKKLKLVLTAGIGSDHIDLHAAADNGLTVAEVTGSNVVSVAEDEVMRMLLLIRNFLPAHEQSRRGDWNVPAVADNSYDLENKTIGTVGGGAIGYEVMRRLKTWNVKRLYFGRHNKENMDEDGVELVKDMDEFLKQCDVVTINVPLTEKTRGMFNKETIGKMKKGAYLINNARGAICERQAVVDACESGHLSGYSGDVWDEQPAPKDHPWRKMKANAMTPHTSGTTLDAQVRYKKGVLTMLTQWLENKPFDESNYIVREGKLAEQYT